MAAPKSIKNKAVALNKALARVAALSCEIEDWVAKKTDDYNASEFYMEYKLDMPFEFRLEEVLEALDEIAAN